MNAYAPAIVGFVALVMVAIAAAIIGRVRKPAQAQAGETRQRRDAKTGSARKGEHAVPKGCAQVIRRRKRNDGTP